jgi:hypothetical protein
VDNNRPSEPRRSLAEIVEEAGLELEDRFDGRSEKLRVQVYLLAYLLTQLAKFGRCLKSWFSAHQNRPN